MNRPLVSPRLRRRFLVGLAALLAVFQSTCRRGPADPSPLDLTLTIVSGDDQFGPPAQFLIDSLAVIVTHPGGLPADGILVDWAVTGGPAVAQTVPQAISSDSVGLARVRLRLGSELGKYLVRASVRNLPEEAVDFEVWAVLPSTLSALSTDMVNAGDVITLTGTNFSPIAAHNVVLFSGIAGTAVAADMGRLDVIVPPCLPTRTVDVSVQLGGVTSTSISLAVTTSAAVLDLALGADTTFRIDDTPTCVRVGSGNPEEYLAVVQSTATIGAARFDYTFTGLRTGSVSAPSHSDRVPRSHEARHDASLNRAQSDWDELLRERESLLTASGAAAVGGGEGSPRGIPRIGEIGEFDVVRADGGFDRVTAKVRLVSQRAVLYEDISAQGSLTQADVQLFADLFDDPIYSVDVGACGSPSDLDGNGLVIILFTPTVNRLSPPGSNDLVGGFFFGLDLMPGLEHSNAGEVFYVLVPDPTGKHGNVRSVDLIRTTVPPILAHELQHMIHHNKRIIELGAPRRDATWLSEGLAHMAEDLVGMELIKRGRIAEANQYQRGNRKRASLFLTEPQDVSLTIASGQGSLEERGAAWLFLEYLRGQAGTDNVLRSLTATTLTGTTNVESVTGRNWADVFSDWSAALELERQEFERGPLPLRDELRFLGFDLMEALALGGDGFPSRPASYLSGDFSAQGRVWSSSGAYSLLGTQVGGMGVSLSGLNGGLAPRNSGLRFKLVRVF